QRDWRALGAVGFREIVRYRAEHEAMMEIGELAAAAGLQQLRIAELVLTDRAAELEALRPFRFDRRYRQEQRTREIAPGAERGLGEGFVGCDVCNALGEGGGR